MFLLPVLIFQNTSRKEWWGVELSKVKGSEGTSEETERDKGYVGGWWVIWGIRYHFQPHLTELHCNIAWDTGTEPPQHWWSGMLGGQWRRVTASDKKEGWGSFPTNPTLYCGSIRVSRASWSRQAWESLEVLPAHACCSNCLACSLTDSFVLRPLGISISASNFSMLSLSSTFSSCSSRSEESQRACSCSAP